VHLRAVIGDQTVIDTGQAWPGTDQRNRVIANRRLVNDTHTNAYADSTFRKGKTFRWATNDDGTTEWIFRPQDFKREFRYRGINESVEFGNYLQLEEVPGWSNTRELSSQRARLQFALLSYVFYLSALVSDRSGRTTWALNTSFVDKSKITQNTTAVTWGDDPMYQLRRTIVARQWTQEPGWKTSQLARFSGTTAFGHLLEHFWWQHDPLASTIGKGGANWSSLSLSADSYTNWHATNTNSNFRLHPAYANLNRQLGAYSGGAVSNALGNWSWSQSPAWAPCITRDLHPYFLLPPSVLLSLIHI
jgi:hypothetical protein